jgi:glycosyltransferase involved in cell wall biosynthesis
MQRCRGAEDHGSEKHFFDYGIYSRMKVLVIATAYPRYPGDVITPWLPELLKHLQEKGIEVTVFTSSYKGSGYHVLDGIPVYRFRYFFKPFERLTHEEMAADRFSRGVLPKILSAWYLVCGMISIYRFTRHRFFDIIHVHWPFPHILFGIFGKATSSARIVSSFHGAEIRWLKRKFPLLLNVFRSLINRSSCITTNSSHTARELGTVVNRPVAIVPFSSTIGQYDGPVSDEKEILFVGRLVERKGVAFLIKAMAKIHTRIPHHLYIVGDGPDRKELELLVQQCDLTNRITFTGYVADDALAERFKRCSFFVLPAVYDKKGDIEGLGVVLIEAMAYSKPVIASQAGGIVDIVQDKKNGYLVPPGDVDALADAMEKLALDNHDRCLMGKKAKQTVDEKFNWDTIVHHVIRLYKQT